MRSNKKRRKMSIYGPLRTNAYFGFGLWAAAAAQHPVAAEQTQKVHFLGLKVLTEKIVPRDFALSVKFFFLQLSPNLKIFLHRKAKI